MTDYFKFAITFDVDWAPNWMMQEIAATLISNEVKSTWFVTHDCSFLYVLRQRPDLFEIGIHPNCYSNSTQGGCEEEVLRKLKKNIPEAISMRTHGLYQNTSFLAKAALDHGIKIDSSLFLPRTDFITPHFLGWNKAKLVRIPFFWSDDFECFQQESFYRLSSSIFNGSGLKIFNFHPVHVFLNTAQFKTYEKLKSLNLTPDKWTKDIIKQHRWNGDGTNKLFMDLISYLRPGGYFLCELIEEKFRTKL